MNKLFRFLMLVLLLTTVSCNDEYDLFEDSLLEYSKSDSKITTDEFGKLADLIKPFENERKFKKFFTNGSFDELKLISFLEKKGEKVEKRISTDESKDYFVNVYIENSGSMNGYVQGNTQFKGAIRDLLVMLKYHYDEKNLKINFINSAIYPTNIEGNIVNFSKSLNAKTFKVGDTYSSNLNNIFKQILTKTSQNTISILVSDCIYSIQGNKTEDLLSDQKSLTKDAFLTKFKNKEPLATTIVKLNSSFNGTYYDKDNKKTQLNNISRPYYMSIIGSEKAMMKFNSNIELSKNKVEGFENKYNLTLKDYSKEVYYSVINTKEDSGSYKPDREYKNNGAVQGIKDVDINSRNSSSFIFSVALDLSKVPIEDSYIFDKSNYSIREGDFKIKGIFKFDKKQLGSSSINMLSKAKAAPTHYIVFESTKPNLTNLTFTINKQIPQWVYTTSTNDDSNILKSPNSTFGIKYLIEGISEAYETESDNNNYLELTINIKK
ncbi:hypothetical protein [Flavobacterium sp. LB2P53]|uniref:hypothetical protein n=1 Tax=Flavobacterium sp. LB2P53 TaxID=2497481 RepID=UPI000F81FBB1|nr:hypothetical protein [Flavobacterium sp. LB2P53]RTY67060.1 hypothetical protein EKL95_09780 [Flavobacterium sp. LB2P53]